MGCCNIKINVKTRPVKLGVSTKLMATGKQAYPSTVELDMVDGDQILEPIEGRVFSKVTVKKPNTLVAENIRKDINIGGVVGNLKPYVPVVSSELNVEPKTEIQIFTPSENEYYDKVNVGAVTSSIDSNIVPENIRNNVEILGVKGTMLPKGLDAMQWKCDNMKILYQEFKGYAGTSLDEPLSVIDTGNVTNMSFMFDSCGNITSIPQINTSSVAKMQNMFNNCYALTTIPLLNTINVTNMSNMFSNCSKLTTIPLLNTINVTDMSYMFAACGNLITMPLLNTSNVINAASMFQNCSKLTTVPQLNTGKVKTMTDMFYNCRALTTVPQLDTSNVTNMNTMFYGCAALTTVPQLNTSKATYMSNMFGSCVNLTTVAGLDMINVTNTNSMFSNNMNLTNLTLKNIKRNLTIGSGTSWGHLLTVDSLVNTIKELWDYSSGTTRKLSMGSANLEKIANIYVKLITPTQEQIEADPYINNKMPCELCESTDEGAMTITAYANLKHWTLA